MSKSDKNQKAVALKYNTDQDLAPVVIASGYGEIAEKIINIAENRGIPVYRDDSAASMMCMLDVGTSIPEELYEVVAAVYSQILTTSAGLKTPVKKAMVQEATPSSRELEKHLDE